MHRRREVDSGAAGQILKEAQDAGRSIEGIIFPVMDWREHLIGVHFVDCDVGRLKFAARPFQTIRLSDVAFIDCGGPHHLRYKGVEFRRSSWRGGRLSGSINSSMLLDCRLESTEIDDLVLSNVQIRNLTVANAAGQGLTIRDSTVLQASMSGRLDHVSLIDLNLEEVDLAGLHVTDGGLLGIKGSVALPDFRDSFVVPAVSVAALKPTLQDLVRPEARATLDSLTDDGVELEWFDARRLDAALGDGPRLLPAEQQAVLHVLWKHRELTVLGVPPVRPSSP